MRRRSGICVVLSGNTKDYQLLRGIIVNVLRRQCGGMSKECMEVVCIHVFVGSIKHSNKFRI